MIRRAFAGLLAAALLVLAPSAAFGYSEDDFDAEISTTNPAPGEAFTVTVEAPSGTDVTLTVSSDAVDDDDIQIAGTKSLTKTAVDGAAVFSVTLTEEAVFSIVATDNDGDVIETFQVVVGDGGTTTDDGDDNDGAAGGDTDGAAGPTLPETGATATPLIIGGVVLLLVGGAALFLARRGKVTA
ncbi:LPXTG-motif cell wall anchor domain-containing protein [Georgenia satyanarayanai]|uniref:LPXTG-motif cell wall anchor domain-containing protein n=1 Tax=Georgenia satyanarayanai TaxID=860221 RepID=A0A2Y9AS66_9MICO|nr:LPXTG cell wall anchor domain-containing protein [Georgenia satyanarayanai]PYF95939.1 LPXTG-motif cell wall-anchored protein [Georgenia satyanarayanai]SSA47260.1 LPXTG-motif cell wall anchor domain-containing protein [Georgenia satyanarayanai]